MTVDGNSRCPGDQFCEPNDKREMNGGRSSLLFGGRPAERGQIRCAPIAVQHLRHVMVVAPPRGQAGTADHRCSVARRQIRVAGNDCSRSSGATMASHDAEHCQYRIRTVVARDRCTDISTPHPRAARERPGRQAFCGARRNVRPAARRVFAAAAIPSRRVVLVAGAVAPTHPTRSTTLAREHARAGPVRDLDSGQLVHPGRPVSVGSRASRSVNPTDRRRPGSASCRRSL
jgi:hypothetical protein